MNAWDKIYEIEGKRAIYPDEFVIRFVNKCLKKGMEVLDLGCGPGRHIIYLAKEGFKTYGIDQSSTAIKMAKTWCKKEKIKANLQTKDMIKLPYQDNSFDAVIDCASIQHNVQEDINQIINEIYRILRKGGYLFMFCRSVHDSFSGQGKMIEPGTYIFNQKSIIKKMKHQIKKPTHFFCRYELDILFKKFEKVHIEYTERTFDGMNQKITHFIVEAKK